MELGAKMACDACDQRHPFLWDEREEEPPDRTLTTVTRVSHSMSASCSPNNEEK